MRYSTVGCLIRVIRLCFPEDTTMARRTSVVIVTFFLGCLAAPLASAAQQAGKKPRIGVLSFYNPPSAATLQRAPFWQALREHGWVEGQNLEVERRYAAGHEEQLPDLAAELVRLPVDVILASGPQEARAAKAASDTIPIVFTSAGDPIRNRLVASLAHPGGNMTGLSIVSPELNGKRLELLKEAAPGISRVAVLTNFQVNYLLAEMTHAAQSLGVTLYPLDTRASDEDELDHALTAMMTVHADALLVLSAPLFTLQSQRVVKLAAASRLPTIYPFRYFVDAGGLMSYGPSVSHQQRRAAYYVDRILKGAKPGDLPVEQPMVFELIINLKTAQDLGLTIPPTLLFQADEVIK